MCRGQITCKKRERERLRITVLLSEYQDRMQVLLGQMVLYSSERKPYVRSLTLTDLTEQAESKV